MWAARGGGGGFGVVTAMEFELLPVPRAYAGMLAWDWTQADRVLRAWRSWAATCPDDRHHRRPTVPGPRRGLAARPTSAGGGSSSSTARCSGTRRGPSGCSRPCGRCGPRSTPSTSSRPRPLAHMHLDPEAPTAVYANSVLLDDLPERAIEALVAAAGPDSGSALLFVEIRHLGGALSRPAPRGGVLDRMDGEFLVLGVGIDDGAGWPAVREEANRVMSALQPWDSGSSYLLMARRAGRRTTRLVGRVLAAPRSGARGGRPARAVRAAPSRDRPSADRPGSSRPQVALKRPGPPWCTSAHHDPGGTMTLVETRADLITPYAPFADLDARTTGTVAVPGDEAYDALVSPWNLAIPVRPAAVLAARTAQDVVEAVRFAGRHGLLVTPQATGHGPIAELVGELLVTTAGPRRVRRPPRGLGTRRRRREVAPRRRGGRSLRPGTAVRVDHRRRHRRLHHRRRARADGPDLRPGDRPGARHRGRHRRRRPAAGDPDRAPRPVLRPARRQGDARASSPRSSSTSCTSPRSTAARCGSTATTPATVIERWLHWSDDLPELATTSFALFQLPAMPGVPPSSPSG